MRDLLYKNLTSSDRRRKVISSSEIVDKEGVHSVVHRHFSCIVEEVSGADFISPQPSLYVLKERNTKENQEHFFCKVKGSILASGSDKRYNIHFIHTLSIRLTASVVKSANL